MTRVDKIVARCPCCREKRYRISSNQDDPYGHKRHCEDCTATWHPEVMAATIRYAVYADGRFRNEANKKAMWWRT